MPHSQPLIYNKKSDLALFHMSIKSLQFYFDELETFLANCPIYFQIPGITESRLKEANPPTTSMILPEFNFEHMPTKSANGDALLYINII